MATGPAGGRLQPRQRRFVEEYLIDLNATAAARRAGYKHPNKQGPRLLVHVGIAEAIAVAQAEHSATSWLTREYVLSGLKGEAENRGDGGSASARVAALKLLGQHQGMFADVHEHTFPEGIPFSPDEARAARRVVEEHRRERLNGSANGTPDGRAPG